MNRHKNVAFNSIFQLSQAVDRSGNFCIEITSFSLFYQAGIILTPFERIPLYSNFIAQYFLLLAYAPLMSGSVKKVNISVYVVHKGLYNLFIHYYAYVKNLHK